MGWCAGAAVGCHDLAIVFHVEQGRRRGAYVVDSRRLTVDSPPKILKLRTAHRLVRCCGRAHAKAPLDPRRVSDERRCLYPRRILLVRRLALPLLPPKRGVPRTTYRRWGMRGRAWALWSRTHPGHGRASDRLHGP